MNDAIQTALTEAGYLKAESNASMWSAVRDAMNESKGFDNAQMKLHKKDIREALILALEPNQVSTVTKAANPYMSVCAPIAQAGLSVPSSNGDAQCMDLILKVRDGKQPSAKKVAEFAARWEKIADIVAEFYEDEKVAYPLDSDNQWATAESAGTKEEPAANPQSRDSISFDADLLALFGKSADATGLVTVEALAQVLFEEYEVDAKEVIADAVAA